MDQLKVGDKVTHVGLTERKGKVTFVDDETIKVHWENDWNEISYTAYSHPLIRRN